MSEQTPLDHIENVPKKTQRKRLQRGLLALAGLMLLSTPLAGLWMVHDLAGKVIYYKYGPERWARQRPGICSPSRRELVYADLRPTGLGADHYRPGLPSRDKYTALEFSCNQARRLSAASAYAQTQDGLRIHYRIFASDLGANAPLLLHVPGITSAWLDGARYAGAARRMGFRLAVLELRNHGISDNDGFGAGYGCREAKDVLAVAKALMQRYPQSQLLIWGSSMGSMSILNAAAELEQFPKVRALVIENPPTSLREVVEVSFAPGRPKPLYDAVLAMASFRSQVDYGRCAPISLTPQLQLPAFVTVAQADSLTPVSMVEKVYQSLPTGKGHQFKIYPHGDHAAIWNGQPKTYEADILAFWRGMAL
ncbi:MAG: hypothetical protein CVV27_07785 [Candidatus Melainabacteria bacterium HGW-Melainabacteria-1]|nr:MAG: hypothetical protein CVV27_07785 [Candidatus Melainabacteria bacterium HGW-Melainabacteria-1]